jgi:chemotaxis protein methyltransferase CheR
MSAVPLIQDSEGVQFLQWCLPRLGLRWPGFRKVRKRVYKRVVRRIQELGLSGLSAYRVYLDTRGDEWAVLDGFCRIPISRFYRDRAVFQYLEEEVLPELGALAAHRGETELNCWSIGCAAGEEPYTLAIVASGPGLRLPTSVYASYYRRRPSLARALGCYVDTSDRRRPAPSGLRPGRSGVVRREVPGWRDVRGAGHAPGGPTGAVDLILCRTWHSYFDRPAQRPATIVGVWRRGRLVISRGLIRTGLVGSLVRESGYIAGGDRGMGSVRLTGEEEPQRCAAAWRAMSGFKRGRGRRRLAGGMQTGGIS